MKRRFAGVVLGVALCMVFLSISSAGAVDFSGDYVLKSPKVTVTLSLSQNQQGKISGLLSSTTGAKFQVVGKLQEERAVGMCQIGAKGAPFEAFFKGNSLIFIVLNKGGKKTTLRFPVTQAKRQAPRHRSGNQGTMGSHGEGALHSGKKSPDSLKGRWICRTPNGNLLLHFLSPNRLTFNGAPAIYTATRDKITVQADGQAYVYPYYFEERGLVITFPNGVKALFVRDSGEASSPGGKVFSQLLGKWKDIRSSGHTIIVLMADGTYSYYSDFAAGNSAQGDTNWGYGNSSRDRGTWKAVGTPRRGTIYYQSQQGGSDTLSYQVHVENGRTYWGEYYFDGKLYVKQ